MKLGGRDDWTGEQIQAAPWVVQKALDIRERGGKNPDGSFKLSYDQAFARANTTIADFYDKHTYFATHEAQPGKDVVGHMSQSPSASQAQREAFANDPRSNWATAPGDRDAIYAGTGVEGTGAFMRVRPSLPMQGYYVRPDGTLETNPGQVARPLGSFDTSAGPFKQATAHDRALMDAGEAFRGYVDAQNASAWHKHWRGGPLKESGSLFFPREGPASVAEMKALQEKASQYGLGDIADTGQGITSTSFYPGPVGGKDFDAAVRKGEFGKFGEPHRTRVDAGYIDYAGEGKWLKPGSGEATMKMLEYVNKTPEIRAAFNSNPYIAERALARLERDESWAKQWGAPRKDIQNARRIIAGGPGWVDRLEQALKTGAVSLPAFAALLYGAAMPQSEEF